MIDKSNIDALMDIAQGICNERDNCHRMATAFHIVGNERLETQFSLMAARLDRYQSELRTQVGTIAHNNVRAAEQSIANTVNAAIAAATVKG